MPIQRDWDEYEVALLIEAFFDIQRDNKRKKEILNTLSENLRKRALSLGYEIDDTFRNLNGMIWQVKYIEKAFNGLRFDSRNPSALFMKMADMYKKRPDEFNKYLSFAKEQINGGNGMSLTQDIPSFGEWLIAKYGNKYSPQAIMKALDEASQYAISRKISRVELTAIEKSTDFSRIINQIIGNRFFRFIHSNCARLLDKAAPIYKQYLEEQNNLFEQERNKINEQAMATNTVRQSSYNNQSRNTISLNTIGSILKSSFQYGIRLTSVRDLLRFRIAAEKAHIALPDDDEKLKQLLLECGTVIEDKVYAISENWENELREKIEAIFSTGVGIIYYESFFYSEQQWMESHHITSEDVLKNVLKNELKGEYNYTRLFISKNEKKTEYEALSEELKRVWGDNAIAEIDRLDKDLPFVPYENIQRVLFATNHFVSVSDGKYLLIDKILISEDEEKNILDFVEQSCKENGFASLTDIPLGFIAENNGIVKENALYTAIYNKILKERYHKNGKILTKANSSMDIVSIVATEFRYREVVRLHEVDERVTELNGGCNRQASYAILYNYFVRVSEDTFVSSSKLHFDVEEIDRVLSNILTDGYAAIRDITTFAMFPVCGVPWNHFVLESYCYRYSRRFFLCILNFNSKNAGIIAEKNRDNSYDYILARALAKSQIELTEASAGDYLFNRGMLSKRKYANLGKIIIEAERMRKEI